MRPYMKYANQSLNIKTEEKKSVNNVKKPIENRSSGKKSCNAPLRMTSDRVNKYDINYEIL